MKLRYILALGALALCFALSACSSSAKKPQPTDAGDPAAAAKDLASNEDGAPESHRKTVVSRAEEFRKCYQPALKRDPKLRGAVTIKWDVNSDGDVVKEEIIATNTTIHDKLMIECMLDRVHNWKFDTGPKDTVSTVVYPFYFNPSL